jgi:2-polyprenyl-3-methyl-5-hydroxy-6-metoxy-1,4-benzoquinol methylase
MVIPGTDGYSYQNLELHPDPPHQPMYLRKMLKYLGAQRSIRTVLDAGCGDGNFAASLADAGYDIYGFDMSASGIKIAQRRGLGRFAQASVYDDFTTIFDDMDVFDAVVAVEVIEHLYDPRLFIKRARAALKDEGLMLVTTPYWGWFKNVVLAVTNRMDRSLTALWDGGHIKHWSRKTLTELMTEQGMEFIAFEGAGRPVPFLWNGMLLVFRKPLTRPTDPDQAR